ncbi:MAG TPA: XdhC family protein [Gemmatimonadaceae bacterium]|nr:XdhC family protein [Gemmatimonadaceae bacterium]
MSSHIAIARSLKQAAELRESVVLATVVRVVGSSYGGVGARMVIRVDGSTVGLVSGGCLESDLCAHALEVHSSGIARVVTYDTRADDDAVWGLGLGCNGLIDVLLQPLAAAQARQHADLLTAALSADAPSVIATVTMSGRATGVPEVGAQALFAGADAITVGDWANRNDLAFARAQFDEALATGRRGLSRETGSIELAFEVVVPAVRLVICGSGPDVAPVSRLARELGWDTVVVDHRPITEAHTNRFPDARVVECREPSDLADAARLTPGTAGVVMSHHFARDIGYVSALLAAGVGYVGVLGPRARTDRMLAELAAKGDPAAASGGSLFGPVGLDVGGDGPEAIALAIIAEVSAVVHGRLPRHLRDRPDALHGALLPGQRASIAPDEG